MRLRPRQDNEPDLNLTPLIDVVFLLLIFFMVSTTFDKNAEISIELPEAAGEAVKTQQFKIEISIDSEGRFFVNQKRVKDDKLVTLKRAIRLTLGDHRNPKLIISADKMTPHGAVVRAMDAARQLGLVNLTFATRQSSGED
ncbi:MAG TPA: biopolymer transporter ExbD [Chromatiales bacterium]|nr:biopolymer transporter ExbD [Chromatiales bacterium]